jgi:hypothetical protein
LEKAASIVIAAHGGDHSAVDKQRACKQVKSFTKAFDKRQRYPLSHQLVYPATPQELSSDKFQFAYADDGPVNVPVDVDVFGVYTNMAYRRSHRSLRPSSDQLAPLGVLAPSGGDSAMQAMVQQAMQPIFAFANAFMHQLPPNPQGATGGVRISCSTAINAATRHASPMLRNNATQRGSAIRRATAARRGDAAGLTTRGGAAF